MKSHFKLETTSLISALAACRRITERRSPLPVLGMIRIDGGSRVTVTATDADCELVVPVAGEGSGSLLFSPYDLGTRMIGMPNGVTEIHAVSETMVTAMVNNRIKATLPTLPVSEFPALVLKKVVGGATLNSDVFGWAVEACAPAVSVEETRYYLNGIHLASDSFEKHKGLRAIATNGHILVRANLSEAKDDGKAKVAGINAIVPHKACLLVEALLRETPIEADISIRQHDGRMIVFQAGDWIVRTKTIDGEFPDANKVIPRLDPKFTTVRIEAPLFESSVRTLGRAAKALRVEAKGDDAHLSTGTDEDGMLETVPCQTSKSITFGINADYLAALLGNCDEDAILVMEDATSPIRIINTAERDLIQVSMPLRLGAQPRADEPEVKALPAPEAAKKPEPAAKPKKAATRKSGKGSPAQAAA